MVYDLINSNIRDNKVSGLNYKVKEIGRLKYILYGD